MLSNLGTRIQSAWNDLEEIVINGERRGQINTGTLLTELGVFCEELKLASAQPVASDPASAKAVEVAITSVKQWVNQFISLNNKYLSSAYCNQCNGFCDHHSAFRYGMKKAEERAKRVISAEPMIKMEDLQHGLNAVRQQVGDETFSKVHAILQATIPDYGLMLSEIVMCDENGNMVTSPVLHRSGLMDRASVYPTPNAAKELGF
jgi:hypothetical protein